MPFTHPLTRRVSLAACSCLALLGAVAPIDAAAANEEVRDGPVPDWVAPATWERPALS